MKLKIYKKKKIGLKRIMLNLENDFELLIDDM
jgi:hypothetical protein